MEDEEDLQQPLKRRKFVDSLQAAACSFNEEGWLLVDTLQLRHPAEVSTFISPPHPLSRTEFFHCIIDEHIWELMAAAVNKTLVATENCATSSRQRSRRKHTTPEEMRKWYGIYMGIETTFVEFNSLYENPSERFTTSIWGSGNGNGSLFCFAWCTESIN